jgi:hypothetical protein
MATVYKLAWRGIPEDLNLYEHTLEAQSDTGCDMFTYHVLLFSVVGTAFMHLEYALLRKSKMP